MRRHLLLFITRKQETPLSPPHIGAQVFPTTGRMPQALGQVVVEFSILFEALKFTKIQALALGLGFTCRLFAGASGRTSGGQRSE